MRRFAHLAILPSLFMIFTEVRDGSGTKTPVVIDMTHATIRPAAASTKSYYPGAMTEIGPGRGRTIIVTTPFEDVMKRLTHGPGGDEDMRPASDSPSPKP